MNKNFGKQQLPSQLLSELLLQNKIGAKILGSEKIAKIKITTKLLNAKKRVRVVLVRMQKNKTWNGMRWNKIEHPESGSNGSRQERTGLD